MDLFNKIVDLFNKTVDFLFDRGFFSTYRNPPGYRTAFSGEIGFRYVVLLVFEI